MLSVGMTRRSRHYAIEWHYVQGCVEEKELKITWVSTEDNLADFFTKKLPKQRFIKLRNTIMGIRDQPPERVVNL